MKTQKLLKREERSDIYPTTKHTPSTSSPNHLPTCPLLTVNPTNLCNNSNVQNVMLLHWRNKSDVLKHMNGHQSTCTIINSHLPVSTHTKFHQLPFHECWSDLYDVTPDSVYRQFKNGIPTCSLIHTVSRY